MQRLRKYKKVFRREKDARRDQESKVNQREGLMVAQDLVWAIMFLTRGTKIT